MQCSSTVGVQYSAVQSSQVLPNWLLHSCAIQPPAFVLLNPLLPGSSRGSVLTHRPVLPTHRAAWMTVRSCTFVKAPTLMRLRSPRSTHPYQMEVCRQAGRQAKQQANKQAGKGWVGEMMSSGGSGGVAWRGKAAKGLVRWQEEIRQLCPAANIQPNHVARMAHDQSGLQ